jgi:trimeric autotransporter adhesin
MDKYSSLNNSNHIVKLDTLSQKSQNKPAHKSPSLNSNFKLTSKITNNNNNGRDQRKTVAFEDTPPVVIETSNQDSNSNNDTLTQDKLIIGNNKLKRTSLTKLIGNSQVLTNKISLTISAKNTDDDSDKLSHEPATAAAATVAVAVNIDNSQKFEPEPDYWDVPEDKNQVTKSENEKQAKTNSNPKAAVSLAEILVKSISSTTSSNSNKSDSLSSSSSLVDSGEIKKKLPTPIAKSTESETSESKSVDLIAKKFASLNEMGILAKSSLNKRYLDSFNNKSETSSISTTTPSLPAIDYDNDNELKNDNNNESLNETNSINQKHNDDIYSSLINEEQNNTTSLIISSSSPTPPPPPPPPPPPFIGQTDLTTKTLVTSISNESLLQAKQKLKIQPTNLPESNELTIASSSIPSCSSSMSSSSSIENKSPSNDSKSSVNKKNDFFLKEIQNHRLYNSKKDYVLDFLDRNSNSGSKHTYTTTKLKPNNDSNEKDNNNNKSCLIVVNNKQQQQQMNRTLSNVNLTKPTDTTSLQDDSLVNYSMTKSESFDSNQSLKKEEEQQSSIITMTTTTSVQDTLVEQKPKLSSNYERFPYIRNRQITPQPNTKYLNMNYANYYNVTKQRAKSNGFDPNRVANKNEQPIIENQIQKSLKSVSADHLNQLDNQVKVDNQDLTTTKQQSNKKIATILINYEQNKLVRSHQSLSSLNQDKLNESIINNSYDETDNIHKPNIHNSSSSNLNLVAKKFRQLQLPEKTESELDRVFKV